MAGLKCPSTAILRRRKRKATSRRWALRCNRQLNASQPSESTVLSSSGSCALSTAVAASPPSLGDTSVQVVRKWAPAVGVRMLLLAVGGMCQDWRSRLAQVCAGLLNALLYWQGYTQQLESLQQQVVELKTEMNILHCALQFGGEAKAVCCCHRSGVGVGMTQPHLAHGYGSTVDPLPVLTLPAPPPPPPPPPPPLPPPPPVLLPNIPLLFIKKRATPKTLQATQEKPVCSATVTLRDLQAVKLRKVTGPIRKQKMSPEKRCVPQVTVADLQKVRLRRSLCDLPPKQRFSLGRRANPPDFAGRLPENQPNSQPYDHVLCPPGFGHKKSPMKSMQSVRSKLKKVLIDRSPGGTPLVDKENRETGTGLTPIMTQALRRKFQCAVPRSPSPKSKSIGSFDELN